MTNNAPVFWEIQRADGSWFSLNTYAWSVKSYGGRRWYAGAKRGEDLLMPHRRGRVWIPKTRESQSFEMNMWVFPTNEDGSKDPTKTLEQKAHQNFRKIIESADQEGQFRLRKRWHEDDSVEDDFWTQTNVATAIGLAEFMDGSGPDTDDGKGFYTTLTLAMPDPYFYGNVITGTGDSDWTIAEKVATAATLTNNSTTVINLDGEAPTDHVWINLVNSSTTNPVITFPDGNWIQYLSQYAGSPNAEVMIDCQSGLALQKGMSAYFGGDRTGTYVNGLIRRNPYFQNWPTLDPVKYPSSTITASGSGTMKLVYDPAYR